jgi:hypothetical protein
MKRLLTVLLILNFTTHAAEIDSFTPRHISFPDGLPFISEEVNKRIKNGVDKANSISECNSIILQTYLAFELLRPGYGQIEQFINNSASVPKENVLFSDSVYKNIPEPHAFLFGIGEFFFPFGNVIREGRWLIGSDKFGHFMDEGYMFYLKLNADASNLREVLQSSIWSEDTYNGLTFGGIKSYGDLVANYSGMKFWSNLVGPKFISATPYLKCQNKRWKILRIFDFREYVDAGWDEAVNCSEYKSHEFSESIKTTVAKLKTQNGTNLNCPIYPLDCVELVKKYQGLTPQLISPKCINAKAN